MTFKGFLKLLILYSLTLPSLGQGRSLAPTQPPLSDSLFEEYINKTKSHIEKNRIFIDKKNRQQEVLLNLPFEKKQACFDKQKNKKGILLIHGITDSPAVWLDISDELAKRCFLVRSILLPGHGTKPEDLIVATSREWVQTVETQYKNLKKRVNQIYLGGFSLGGALSVLITLKNHDVSGLVLLAPALKLKKFFERLTPFIPLYSLFTDILVKARGKMNPIKYDAFPVRGVSSLIEVQRQLNNLLETKPIDTPVFMVISESDAVLDPFDLTDIFTSRFTNPKNRLLIYKDKRKNHFSKYKDPRLIFKNSYLPEQNIVNFSHLSLPISPKHPIYGKGKKLNHCFDPHNVTLEKCLKAKKVLYGAWTHKKKPITSRLTFNPHFEDMINKVAQFLNEN